MVRDILTERNYLKKVFWQPVYEWEDELAREYCLNLVPNNDTKNVRSYKKLFFNNKIQLTFLFKNNTFEKSTIVFCMDICSIRKVLFRKGNYVPIFIDIWGKDILILEKILPKFSMVYVTSYQIFVKLREKHNNLGYLPLMVSDYWRSFQYPKIHDIVQIGRKNPKLHKWALMLVKKHPHIEYIYQQSDGSQIYFSTKEGVLGKYSHRESFMRLLSQSKISLVSSPGMDNSRKGIGEVDVVTPRLYESILSGCHAIGRYRLNEEYFHLNIDKVIKNVKNYNDFEKSILSCVGDEIKKDEYIDFIIKFFPKNVFKNIIR